MEQLNALVMLNIHEYIVPHLDPHRLQVKLLRIDFELS